MQYMAIAVTRARLIVPGLALLLSIGFGSVAVASSEVGLTACDQSGCAVGLPSSTATYQVVSVTPWFGDGDFISNTPLDMGFTP